MANALYDFGRNEFLLGNIDWVSDTIDSYLLDSDYTVDLANHQDLADVAAGGRVANVALAGKSADGTGVADANDAVFSSVTNPTDVTQIIVYKDSGVEATSSLIVYIDTASNLPVTPNGGDITVQWSGGSDKIFKL